MNKLEQLSLNLGSVAGRARKPGCGRKQVDIAGKRFGRWTVIEKAGLDAAGHVKWFCRCDCGADGVLGGDDLRLGRSKSCGCYDREQSRRRMFSLNAAKKLDKTAIRR